MLFVSIYGFFQLEMREVGLLDKQGRPTKDRKRPLDETESIDLYNEISQKVKNIPEGELKRLAGKVNEVVKNQLVNNKGKINNYLMALMLYRNWLDEIGSIFEQNRFLAKVNRQIAIYEKLEGSNYAEIRKESYRVADNLYRIWTDKPQLDDELRDLRAKRFVR